MPDFSLPKLPELPALYGMQVPSGASAGEPPDETPYGVPKSIFAPAPKVPSMGSLTPPMGMSPGGPVAPSSIPTAMPAAGGAAVSAMSPAFSYKGNKFGIREDADLRDVLEHIVANTKRVESLGSGDYKADRRKVNAKDSASGAYGYIDKTWNNYGGFKRAVDAPPEVQDKRFIADTYRRLLKFKGDPLKTMMEHYYPKYAEKPHLWKDKVNNVSTPKQYLSRIFPKEVVERYLNGVNQAGANSGPAVQYTAKGRP